MNNQIEVTVCIITYNHANYIAQAIESVLAQQTNFNFKILIADDNSTDGTTEIINNYKNNFPDKIDLILQKTNVGPAENFNQLITKPTTNFIAYLDGDDYWIGENKLQLQFEIFNKNDEIGLVYTKVKHFYQAENKLHEIETFNSDDKFKTIENLLVSKFIEFSSVMFRTTYLRQILKTLATDLKIGAVGDTRIILEFAFQHKTSCINLPLTVYRIHAGSASRPSDNAKFISILMDSYIGRKQFVLRNNLKTKWLSNAICNTNKALINKAYKTKLVSNNFLFLKNLLLADTFKFCTFEVFIRKIPFITIVKLVLCLFCLNLVINKLKND